MSKVKESIAWDCGTCETTYLDKKYAVACCNCRICKEDIPRPAYGSPLTVHSECQGKEWHERELETLAKATLIENYDGWVYYGDRYFNDMESLEEYLYDESYDEDINEIEKNWPARVHTCIEQPFPKIDVERIYENIGEELNWDDTDYDFDKCDILEKAIKEFNEANSGMVSYYVDIKHATEVEPFDRSRCED